MTWFVFVLVILASARTWRLADLDEAGYPIRRAYFWISHRFDSRGYTRLSDLVMSAASCPFCSGYWYAVIWFLTGWFWGGTLVWMLLAGSFAANYVAAQLNAWLDIKPVHDGGGETALEDEREEEGL